MTGQLYEEIGMIQVRGDLWINPRALLFVEAFDDSVVLCLNGTEKFISHQDWAAVRPHIVTLSARAAGCACGRESVTAQAVSEIIEEETKLPAAVQWVQVDEVRRDTFYSKTSRGHRAMWRLFTTDGRQVNVFDHADPLRDQKALLQQSDYLTGFQAMEDGQTDRWTAFPIEIDIVADGQFWKLAQINPRAHEAFPDAPVIVEDDYELIEWDDEGNVIHRITSDPPALTTADFAQLPSIEDLVQTEEFWRNAYPDDSDEVRAERMAIAKERLANKAKSDAEGEAQDIASLAARAAAPLADDDPDEGEDE